MMYALYQVSFQFNIFNVVPDPQDQDAQVSTKLKIILQFQILHYHFMCFNPEEKGHSIFGIVYFNLICLGVYTSTYSLNELLSIQTIGKFLPRTLLMGFISVPLIISENTHGELISEIYSQILNH